MDEALDSLVTAVTKSSKYRQISPDLIRRIGSEELAKRRSQKEAVKATKNKLHQVGGAYLESKIDYAEALSRLTAVQADDTAWRQTCRDIMKLHASTWERLPVLADFYGTILAEIAPIHSVVDVACGLNPLAWPWMPLAADVIYTAYDIYGDMMAFLQAVFSLAGMNGRARQRDVLTDPPTEKADLVLLLKTLPCLEQIEKGAAAKILDGVIGRHLLITYPAKSLGGRHKGMVINYEAQFEQLLDGRGWTFKSFLFETELAFLVTTT